MDVVVSGSTGLIGTALIQALSAAGHEPIRLVRPSSDSRSGRTIAWDPDAGTIDAAAFEGIDAVIHLAGAGIGDARWTPERKQLLVESRTASTRLLSETIAGLDDKPSVFLSGSAVGFYGDRGADLLTEADPAGKDFLADLCVQWEAAAEAAEAAGIRVVYLRTGIVQSTRGGALKEQLWLFKLGLGGRMGDGKQFISWISIQDHVRAMLHLIETSGLSGPVNLTAPNPVDNTEFTKTLGHVLGRPTLVPIPKFGPVLRLGKELAEALLYTSTRVKPKALLDDGFEFDHTNLEGALRSLLDR